MTSEREATDPLTSSEIADIKWRHTKNRAGNCHMERFPWPCDALRAALEVERLRAQIAASEAASVWAEDQLAEVGAAADGWMDDLEEARKAREQEQVMLRVSLDRIDALAEERDAAREQLAAGAERYDRLRLACHQQVPEGGPASISGYCCLLCGWDADPSMPDTHEPTCILAAVAEGTGRDHE